jgi:hypothetical protein
MWPVNSKRQFWRQTVIRKPHEKQALFPALKKMLLCQRKIGGDKSSILSRL